MAFQTQKRNKKLSEDERSTVFLRVPQNQPGDLPFSLRVVLVAHVEELEKLHLRTVYGSDEKPRKKIIGKWWFHGVENGKTSENHRKMVVSWG